MKILYLIGAMVWCISVGMHLIKEEWWKMVLVALAAIASIIAYLSF